MNWKNAVTVATSITPKLAVVAGAQPSAVELRAAADRFDARKDAFAAGKGATCRDIAGRVDNGGYASAKQQEFAAKLVEWSKPRDTTAPIVTADAEVTLAIVQLKAAATAYTAAGKTRTAATCADIADKLVKYGSFASEAQKAFGLRLVYDAPGAVTSTTPARDAGLSVAKLFDVMQKHAKLVAGELQLSRKNADTLCWITWRGALVGKIENGMAIVWKGKAGADRDAILTLLAEFDIDPLAAAVKYGKLSGRCCSCGADLTADDSIAAGIGPICRLKF